MPAQATYDVRISWSARASNAFTIGKSVIGGTDVLVSQFSASFDGPYDDVTGRTRSISIRRGRDDNLDPMRAGEATIVLHDPDARFSPANSSSPLAGMILPMRPVRIQATGPGPNLVSNPGFETDVSGWSAVSGATLTRVTSEAHSGNASLRITTPGSAAGEGAQADASSFTPGRTYTAVAWVKGSGQITLRISDGVGSTTSQTVTLTGSWQEISVTRTISASATVLRVILRTPSAQVVTCYADDVNLYDTATTYGLFRGFVRSIEHDPARDARSTTIHAVDLFLWLSRAQPTISSTGETTTGAAIGRILDAVGFDDRTLRDLATGDTIPDFSADGTKTALSLIEELLEAERGAFFVTADGVAHYESRHARSLRITSSGEIADSMGGLMPSTDIDRVRNRATVLRTGGVEQTASDSDSAATYGWADLGRIETPYLQTDSQAASLAAYLVGQRRDPRPPVRAVELVNRDAAILAHMLGRELQDRVTVIETNVSGTSGDYHIEQISHEIEQGGLLHRTTWQLSERGAGNAFVIGSSRIGSTDVITY
jgi:hypothetical protein